MADLSCSDSDTDKCTLSKNGKDSQKGVLAISSNALLSGSPLEAVENFKLALEKLKTNASQKMPITQVVIHYALCVALIKCYDYEHLAEAAEKLLELIDSGYAGKFPALYLALAKAFYALYRFQKALEFIGKGLKCIQTNSKIKQHMWPGLSQVIEETGRDVLQKELLSLEKDCKNCKPPDAFCNFNECEEIDSHISPAKEIYFMDPGFKSFLHMRCSANCSISYHITCWDYLCKNELAIKDTKTLLGKPCLSDKCPSGGSITEISLIGPKGFQNPVHNFHTTGSANNSSVSSGSSSNKAKSKGPPLKEDEECCEEPFTIPSYICNTFCPSEGDPSCELSFDIEKRNAVLEVLKQCRSKKFGYLDDDYMNPELQCFGHLSVNFSTYVPPDEIDDVDNSYAEFVFSYYQSIFDKNGPYRIEDLQETWKTTATDLGLPATFTDKYSSVSEFLLRSERFAAIDDVIGTSDLLPDMFSKAEIEITQSISFLLFSKVSNPRSKDNLNMHDVSDQAWQAKINNNNGDSYSQWSSSPASHTDSTIDSLKGATKNSSRSISDSNNEKDNENPLSSPLKKTKSTQPMLTNGKASNISEKTDMVYMSDDDEEIDSVLVGSPEKGEYSAQCDNLKENCEEIVKPDVVDQDTQTDAVDDVEKINLKKENQTLERELLALKQEKGELREKMEQLQMQMDNSRLVLEKLHNKALKQVQERLEEQIKCKENELTEVQNKCALFEEEVKKYKDLLEESNSNLETTVHKLRTSHAKEINNLMKRLLENKQIKEDDLKNKDQLYIQLWKEYCDFKIKKFHQTCNDRINVLSQLKDIMSDSLKPTKSDIKSSIEKYEEEMIAVTKKSVAVNELYHQETEKFKSGGKVQLPPVIDVPDITNMLYPPEGAFEYLHSLYKLKQDEYPPRNHFAPAVSRFFPTYSSNGTSSISQNRENENYPSISGSSLFGQGHNEANNLWNNTLSSPSVPQLSMGYDISSSNGTLNPFQGFGTSSMMPQLNLLSPILPYHSTPQNPSVQSMMGQTRSTPSPLSYPSVNGNNVNHTTSMPAPVGTKPASIGVIQKPVVTSAQVVMKNVTSVSGSVPSTTVTTATSLGAIPKPRVQTATASLTPIVPNKAPVRPGVKGTKGDSAYEKLMRNLQKMFPTRNDMELTQALKMARYRNGNTLSSLTHSEIVSKVEEILKKQSKQTSMGWEKFGQAAWGTTKAPVVEWHGTEQDECCICMTAMSAKEVYSLECKHTFHKECIRKWLVHDSVCPNCRTHSTMLDEFPPLG